MIERDREAVLAVLERQREAWNRGDLDAFMDGYARSSELVFTSGGTVHRGWDDAFARYQRRYGGDVEGMGTLAFDVLAVQGVGADGAIVLGRWRLEGTAQAGGGVFSVVLERRDGAWRIVHDHTSTS
jgi:uncharacterized protein (TIGR02246 family)